MTITTLQHIRSDREAALFLKKASQSAAVNKVEPAQLPRRRHIPRWFEPGQAAPEFHESVETFYCQIYFTALDAIITCITDHFEQPDYKIYTSCEQVLLKAIGKEPYEELTKVLNFYGNDFDESTLKRDLTMLFHLYKGDVNLRAIVTTGWIIWCAFMCTKTD